MGGREMGLWRGNEWKIKNTERGRESARAQTQASLARANASLANSSELKSASTSSQNSP